MLEKENKKKPLVLVILDGFGESKKQKANAVKAANTPVIDDMLKKWPTTLLNASGLAVGLPKGQIGNSEVGHTNIGAGRIVFQNLVRINNSIEDGSFFSNPAFLKAAKNCKENSSAVHIMGLLSDGGVHSHLNHLFALLEFFKQKNIEKIYVHVFTDGRDVLQTSAAGFLKQLKQKIEQIKAGKIATVSGRFYAMDRDNRWDRVKLCYDAIFNGEGEFLKDPEKAVREFYEKGTTDEFIPPFVCEKDAMVKENDSIVFFNFRPDRARQLTKAITFKNFSEFERKNGFLNLFFVSMTQYDADFKDVFVAFEPLELKNTFGEYISKKGLKQLRIAETEKYAHVTFFFNAGVEEPFEGEDRILVNSPNVKTYDLKPQMSAFLVLEKVVKALESLKYDVVILNFANCDMVGHTGNFEATKKAVETVDSCLLTIFKTVEKLNGTVLVTADHGNAEEMEDENGDIITSHTTNPVIFSVVFKDVKLKSGGSLCDIAPTMLHLLGLEQPKEMTGNNLILN